ncbi:zinc finger protein-domain-containing protein [Annulohypoxylon moriforme]|nr:zinc finger protein-domain-containing protein [Annulohypoxylon moriforme]
MPSATPHNRPNCLDINTKLFSPLDPHEEEHSTETQPLGDIEQRLGHLLSRHSAVSASLSFLQGKQQAAEEIGSNSSFIKIGAGACGAIFAEDGEALVTKLAKAHNKDLWNDYTMHTLIFEKAQAFNVEVQIPRPYFFVPKDDQEYFEKHLNLCETARDTCHLPTDILVAERIVPLPKITRMLLIEKYCVPHHRSDALADPANRDCLVRVYLGSQKGKSRGRFFSLRNLKLHLNQLAELELGVDALSHQMAEALATMQWAAETDARDVEFALGSSSQIIPISPKSYAEIMKMEPASYTGPLSRHHEDFFRRTTQLWLLDFNQVRSVTLDQKGIDQMVDAFKVNDPYFPRPLQKDRLAKRIWNQFVRSYLKTSHFILMNRDKKIQDLPQKFLEGVIEVQRNKEELMLGREYVA